MIPPRVVSVEVSGNNNNNSEDILSVGKWARFKHLLNLQCCLRSCFCPVLFRYLYDSMCSCFPSPASQPPSNDGLVEENVLSEIIECVCECIV